MRSNSKRGLVPSIIIQVIKFFENLGTRGFLVCCPSDKIDDNGNDSDVSVIINGKIYKQVGE